LIGREPKDWDIATNARPEEILRLFPDSVYENNFGTVGVKIEDSRNKTQQVVEVTTFREEGKYTDKRHPDEVKFAKTIEEDLARRDFTINAIAAQFPILTDPYGGREDLKKKVIRAVGKPEERFEEDALRLMRAVRLAAELGFEIEEKTAAAIVKFADGLKDIAAERVRDEFVKIVMCDDSMRGVQTLEDLGLLKHVIPELREGIGCGQNLHHIYSVWEHNLRALDYAAKKGYELEIRLGALLHDVGKPHSKRGEGKHSTFYGHEIHGAKMTAKIMDRLRFSKDIAEKVHHLVRYHLFYYNVGEVSEAGVRRFISRVGIDFVDDLVKIREADRIGSGVPKAKPYKIRHLLFMIDKVRRDPISPKMLAVNGDDIMKILTLPPSPKVGWVLSALMDEVLEEPSRNKTQDLRLRIKELGRLTDKELQEFAKKGREKIGEAELEAEKEMQEKHRV
ncbi:MAG: HD domain-containing protein, partial [Patescibacteria group bacterium]